MAWLAGNGDAPDIFAGNIPANLITGSAYAAAVLPIGDEHVGDTSIQIKDVERACVFAYLVGPGPSLVEIRQYAGQLLLQYEQLQQTPPTSVPSPADGNVGQGALLGDVFVTTTGRRAVIDVRDADGVVASFDLGCPPDRECGVTTARVMDDAIWVAINDTEPGQPDLVVRSRVVSVTRSSGAVVEHLTLDGSARVSSAGMGADGTLYAHVVEANTYDRRLVAIENGGTRTLDPGVAGFRLSDDGRLLAVSFADPPAGEPARFEITDLVDGTTANFDTDYTNAGPAAWSPDGRYLIVNEQWEDGTAWVVDPWSGSDTPIAGTDGYLDGFLDGGCFMSNDVVAHRTWNVGYGQGDAQVGVIRLTDLTSGSTVAELGTNLFGESLRCHADGSVTYVRRGIVEVEHAPGFSQPEPDYDTPVELVHLAPDGTATIRDSGDLRMV
jgi:hypothetical protein